MISTEFDPFDILLLIALALLFARILGYVFNKLKQPAVIGEILAGLILGGLVATFSGRSYLFFTIPFDIPKLDFSSIEFSLLAEIGILFMLFISGLQTSLSKLKQTGKTSTYVAVGGVIIPLILGFITGLFFFGIQEGIIIGLILTATSVGITVRTLMDLQVLDTKVGTTILGGAVIDDVIAVLLLSFALVSDSFTEIIWVSAKILIFFFIFLYLGLKVIDKILDLGEKIQLPKAFVSISLAILLIYSFFAHKAGIASVIGAFVAGLLIGQTVQSRKITPDVITIGYGFFIPLFFVWIGALLWTEGSLDYSTLTIAALLASTVIIVGIIGKIVGCGIGAKIAGFTGKESLQVGIGMIPRMELALIIATAVISRGILTGNVAHLILATTVLLTIVTSLITPVLIKAVFNKE